LEQNRPPPPGGGDGPPPSGGDGPPPSGGGSSLATQAGSAITGGSIYNGLDGSNLDAVENEGQDLDRCLSHSSPFGQLHYHSLSSCVNDSSAYRSQTFKPALCMNTPDCVDEIATWMINGWTGTTTNFGGIFGIARDGHVIYGPYNEDGELWACEDYDVCNGFFLADGSYGYAST
jgi:hypothetical protein